MNNQIKKAWYERSCGECYYWKHTKRDAMGNTPCSIVLGGHKREWTACIEFKEPENAKVVRAIVYY